MCKNYTLNYILYITINLKSKIQVVYTIISHVFIFIFLCLNRIHIFSYIFANISSNFSKLCGYWPGFLGGDGKLSGKRGPKTWHLEPSTKTRKNTPVTYFFVRWLVITLQFQVHSLKLTASSPLKIGKIPKGKDHLPTIHFQGQKC